MPPEITSLKSPGDGVFLRNLALHTPIGPDAWGRFGKPQPVLLSIRIYCDITKAAASDDVGATVDYGKLTKSISKAVKDREEFGSFDLDEFGWRMADVALEALNVVTGSKGCGQIDLDIRLPKAILRADGGFRFKVQAFWKEDPDSTNVWDDFGSVLSVERVKCACIIGVNPHERDERQIVVLDLSARDAAAITFMKCYQDATKNVVERVEGSSFQTVEALATFIARILTMDFKMEECTVSVEKPSALANVEGAGVEITRKSSFFSESEFWASGHHRLGEAGDRMTFN